MVAKTTRIEGEIIALLTLMDVAPLREEGDWWRIASTPEELDLSERTAHELNNILTPIMGYAEMALDDTPSNSRAANDLRHITESVNRAQQLLLELRKARVAAKESAEERQTSSISTADGVVRPPGVPLS
ncbi:MAG: histidine kinase dimerization/phospho-acceptor domain-containing protein [Gammaproteobacteria bacterium]